MLSLALVSRFLFLLSVKHYDNDNANLYSALGKWHVLSTALYICSA